MSDQSPGRSNVPTIRIPEDDLGSAMLALNPAQRAFVYFKVFGLMNNKDAAVAAGYSDTGESAKVLGYRLAHREDVQAAIREETRKLATTEGPPSIAKIIHLRDKAKDEAVQLKAAQDLLNRCGLGAVLQSHLTVEHTDNRPTSEVMADFVKQTAEMLRLPEAFVREQMLDPSRQIIDAQWEEVPKSEQTPAQKREAELQRLRRAMTPEQLAEHKRATRERQSAEAKARYAAAQAATDDDDLFTDGW